MNVQSYTILHYGRDYLPYALRSVYDAVDRLHILYTPHPSHGHRTDARPPDNRAELMQAAFVHDPDRKIAWYDIDTYWNEGPQRDMAVHVCQQAGADMILVVDCDEVWQPVTLQTALDHVWAKNTARNWLINFTHFWRSFDWVCRDNNWPVRIIDLRHSDGTGYVPAEVGAIYHFGYAVREEMMLYKWQIHGHKGELRPDWWEKWDTWPPVPDCHPTNGENWWVAEEFDKALLPELMKSHPFYNLEKIE